MTALRALAAGALLLLLLAASAPALSARAPAAVSYTAEQAWRGRLDYYANCAECHGGNLGGVTGPALAGPDGNLQWQTGADVWSYLTVQMPDGNGGGLAQEQYLEIMAFLYQQHHKPAGDRPLTVRAAAADAAPMGW